MVVAPATTNVIGKLSYGIADDIVTTSMMASESPKLLVPAMNIVMYENPIVQDNIERLKRYEYMSLELEKGTMVMRSEKE